jgi:hypothetical protein
MTDTSDTGAADGLAALSLCESLLLALGDLKLMNAKDIDSVLKRVSVAHRNAAELMKDEDAATHVAVVDHMDRIRRGGNSGSQSAN